jgi:hypothetical protein
VSSPCMHCAQIHFSTGMYVTNYNWSDSFKALLMVR